MTSDTSSEIVGREGLAPNLGAVGQQVSSLEKSMNTQMSALRTEMTLQFDKVGLELKRIETSEVDRQQHHDDIHHLETKALDAAKVVEDHWRANANEWREESKTRMQTYPNKSEIAESFKRIEDLVIRNAADLEANQMKTDDRLKVVERFMGDAKAQMGTIRTLMGVLLFGLTVVGFILGMNR